MSFQDYFSDANIIRILCRMRLKEAAKRRNRNIESKLNPNQDVDEMPRVVSPLLPPRRAWSRYRPGDHNNLEAEKITLVSLVSATHRLRQQGDCWAVELNGLIQRIRDRVFGDSVFTFSPPTPHAIRKKEDEYRAIVQFCLEDKVVDGIVAKYLRDKLDMAFEHASLAFRAEPPDDEPIPSTKSALDILSDVRRKYNDRDLYVAECDIRGFFDCIDHQIARDQLQAVIEKRRQKPILGDETREEIDLRAIHIFNAYLDCYTFRETILEGFLPRLQEQQENAVIKWPEEDLRKIHGEAFMRARIGIPQGGALSGIIANIVLDHADTNIARMTETFAGKVQYLRYCDDMILISPSKAICRKAFHGYLRRLKLFKLPYHEPRSIVFYNKAFWELKSRKPYCWTGRKFFNCVPWIQFVGYQIRYDGLVRIRQQSIAKHRKKVLDLTNRYLRAVRPEEAQGGCFLQLTPDTPYSKESVQASLRGRLTSMAVGRESGNRMGDGPKNKCWAYGFRGIHCNPFVASQLKSLDRFLGKQLARFWRTSVNYGYKKLGNANRSDHHANCGYKQSYLAQFRNEGGNELIRNPWRPQSLADHIRAKIYLLAKRWLRRWTHLG